MSNEVFVAFWAGAGLGVVFGIMLAAIMAAISNSIERKGNNNE